MSYLVLSLKYRPKTFEQIVGQEHITHTLINAFKKDRVSQAYLFTGPRGVGKTTTARLVAKALNCLESPGSPCNKCSNCLEITDGRNMDVLEIDGASNRGIEEIRGLREAIQYSPINSKYKVFIIDEVHMLTTPAFNALLRTLEEPPEHGKFILATTDIYKVPATIISRCQRFDFNTITIKDIIEQINYVLGKEKITIDDESLKIIAQKADGSMRDALSILDQVISFSGEAINIESVTKVLGLIPTEVYFNTLDSIKDKDSKRLIEIFTEVRTKGMPLQEFVIGINRHIRNLLIASADKGIELIEISDDLKIKYTESAKSWDARDLLRISKVISEADFHIRKANQPHILLELTLLRLLEMDSSVSVNSIIDKINKNGLTNTNISPKVNHKTDHSKTISNTSEKIEKNSKTKDTIEKESNVVKKHTINITLTDIEDKWGDFLELLSNERPSIKNALEGCELSGITGNRLEIKMINGNNFNLRTLEKNKLVVEEYLEKNYGVPIGTVFLKSKIDKIKTDKTDKEKEENIKKTNKTTAKIIEMFDGELIN